MAYDNYGRSTRSGDPGYFGTGNYEPDSDYSSSSYYVPEPRTNPSSSRRRDYESSDYRRSPSSTGRMPPPGSQPGGKFLDEMSPAAIAALTAEITARVKEQILGDMKQPGYSTDDSSRDSPTQRVPSNRSSDSLSPPPTARRVYTPPSPLHPPQHVFSSAPQYEEPAPMRSPPASPMERPSEPRFSERNTRPSAARTYSTLELSTIDQKWGRLFDSDGLPTKRLGDVLRGLANHIITCFEPKGTIVVTPAKMAAYYEAYSLDQEPHPLLTIFRAHSNDQICLLYQDLGCEHHLVQENLSSAPIVPALTSRGFAHWMTLHITAYPEQEWYRLEKMVPHLPVDADGDLVDGKPERLPKQISRHLLPHGPDPKSKMLVDDAIASYINAAGSVPRRKPSITSPPMARRSSNSQTRPVEIHQGRNSIPSIPERERKPYSSAPVSDEETGPNNIERERQPYSRQPGGGKEYSDNINSNLPDQRERSNSTRTTNASAPRGRNHSNSTAGQQYIPTAQRKRRTSSPPMKSFRNTAPDLNDSSRYNNTSSFNPDSFGSTGSFPPPPPSGPPPINIPSRDERSYGRSGDVNLDDVEINSPSDAEHFDRWNDAYNRNSYANNTDSRRGAPREDWVGRDRDRDRGDNYYRDRRY